MAVIALMDDRLRNSMLYETPPRLVTLIVHGMLRLRKSYLRHFALPRPKVWRYHNFTEEMSKEGTYHLTAYDALPYYVKPTLWMRYGPSSWAGWTMGNPVPGDDSDEYYPAGYKLQEVGPSFGKGGQLKMEERVAQTASRRCPFAVS